MSENFADKLISKFEKISETDISEAIKSIIGVCKDSYFRIMNSYCDYLDSKNISPNQVVSGRVVTGITTGAVLASGDYGSAMESAGVGILGLTFIHDAVDGHLARRTNQTSREGETLDALGDKIKVFILLAILIATMDIPLRILAPIVGMSGILLLQDIISQNLRGNNIEALKASFKHSLSEQERKNNPNQKTKGAAGIGGKIKTGVIMSGITAGYMKDISDLGQDNSIVLLISLLVANAFSLKSLKDKGVFSKKEA